MLSLQPTQADQTTSHVISSVGSSDLFIATKRLMERRFFSFATTSTLSTSRIGVHLYLIAPRLLIQSSIIVAPLGPCGIVIHSGQCSHSNPSERSAPQLFRVGPVSELLGCRPSGPDTELGTPGPIRSLASW